MRRCLLWWMRHREKGVIKMPDTVIVACISLIGTMLGSFSGTQLIKYRIEQLEKKVEKHNSIVERTYILEEKVKVANHRIDDLERKEEEHEA